MPSEEVISRRAFMGALGAAALPVRSLSGAEKDASLPRRPRDRINWELSYYEQCDDSAFEPSGVSSQASTALTSITRPTGGRVATHRSPW